MANKVVKEPAMLSGAPKEAVLSDVAAAVGELSDVAESLNKLSIYYGEALSEVLRQEECGSEAVPDRPVSTCALVAAINTITNLLSSVNERLNEYLGRLAV